MYRVANLNEDDIEKKDTNELELSKKQRFLNKEFYSIIKEITIFTIFLILLFLVAYLNFLNSSFYFNQLYQRNFVNSQTNGAFDFNEVIFFNLNLSLS